MTYEEALQFWFGRINYEQQTPRKGDLKLDRMAQLLERLGGPHRRVRAVHVAGSKGKGSTAAMLAAVLRRAGHVTGLFTSPHLSRVEERIQIDGEPIAPGELAALMGDVAEVVGQIDAGQPAQEGVTFFEIVTALAFLHFARRGVDLAVLEVGLGGRFDATNVCLPLVSVITSISIDHVAQLGPTVALIAGEKAGIIKPGVPCVSGAAHPDAQAVIARAAAEQGAPLFEIDRDFRYAYTPGVVAPGVERLPSVQVTTRDRRWPGMNLALLGEHQAANAALVVATVELLEQAGVSVGEEAVRYGLQNVQWPARLEVVRRDPLVVLDCAHNRASAEALVETLRTTFPAAPGNGTAAPDAPPRRPRRLLIFATSHDKDISGMLEVLAAAFDHIYLTRYTTNPRYLPPEQLAARLVAQGYTEFTVCGTPREAWDCASAAACAADLVCITGSVFLAGDLRPLLVSGAGAEAAGGTSEVVG